MNQPDSIFPERANARIPRLENRGEVTGELELGSSVADLYAVISILDSAGQSDLAGRLHALTLEIRERAAQMNACQYS
jgi:hypothetical protein